MGQKMEKRGIFDPEVIEEEIIMVKFDDTGIAQEIKDMENMRVAVPLKDGKTPTYGNDVNAVQQILGNLGKFNPQTVQE